MLDKILDELIRKGNKKQERHFQSNVRALNANLAVLTTASDALLVARRDGLEPFAAVFEAVGGEGQLAATVESAKKLIRPLDLDSRDLIQTQYAFVRGVLMALYEAIGSAPCAAPIQRSKPWTTSNSSMGAVGASQPAAHDSEANRLR